MASPLLPVEQDLCTSCGLCCDGTIFGIVRVSADESDRLASLLPLRHDQAHGIVFDQPCPQFSQGCCSIYAQRPARCARYECEVLRAFKAGSLKLDEAERRIAQARKLARDLTGVLEAGATMVDARKALHEAPAAWQDEDADPGQRMLIARARLMTVALNAFLDRHFRRRDQALLPAAYGAEPLS
jgi:Fe-S-cluster containining protein